MGDWQTFSATDNQSLGSIIKGLKICGDAINSFMLILCERHIYVCQFSPETITTGGSGQFIFDQISAKHGCAAPATVEEVYVSGLGFCVMWVDYDGIKIYNSSIGIQKVTDKIRPDWEALNLGNISNFVGKYYKSKGWYILSCSSSASETLDMQIVIDLQNSIPAEDKYVIASIFDWDMATLGTVITSGIEYIIGCDSTGYWNKYDDGQNDNGEAINGYFRTKALGDSSFNKGFQSITFQYAYMGNYGLDIYLYLDNTSETFYTSLDVTLPSGSQLGTFILDQDALMVSGGLAIASEEVKGWGRTIQIRIGNNEVDEPFRIHRMLVNYRPGRMVLAK
jgi:hypothetical protein